MAVSDRPEGPFTLISRYKYDIENHYDDGTFIDPGVLVDDDGRVYVYCGYLGSYMAEINPDNMYEVIDGSYQENIIPVEEPFGFFEACSPRKVGDTYYLIYSPKNGNRLDYATAKSPTGPFTYRGTIVDNGVNYPGGNDHGSICKIKDQWYIFYHRMTNGSCMSRKGCVEKIEILPDGTIPQVEMTSLGFSDALNPFQVTPADTACVLKGSCLITEKNAFTRSIAQIADGDVMGWKYFDFGYGTGSDLLLQLRVKGCGCKGRISVHLDSWKNEALGSVSFGLDDQVLTCRLPDVTGRHSLYLVAHDGYEGWSKEMFKGRSLFELEAFVFMK